MDKKPTDNEIIKALECCSSGDSGCEKDCPLSKECDSPIKSGEKIMQSALDLINRQKAEIERLHKNIDVLRTVNKSQKGLVEMCEKTAKAEAYKEFAERLKEYREIVGYDRDLKCDIYGSHIHIDIDEFDNLLKELVGEDNASKY